MWNLQDVARDHLAEMARMVGGSPRLQSRRKARRLLARPRQLASQAASRGQLAA